MLGFLGVGLVAVLRATDHLGPWGTREYALFVAGTVLVTAAAMVKLPVAVALGFVGIALALVLTAGVRRRTSRSR